MAASVSQWLLLASLVAVASTQEVLTISLEDDMSWSETINFSGPSQNATEILYVMSGFEMYKRLHGVEHPVGFTSVGAPYRAAWNGLRTVCRTHHCTAVHPNPA